MSFTTDLLLCLDYSSDKGIEPFLAAVAAVERFGDTFRKIDMNAAGGTRNYTGAVYALGSNYFPTWELQELMDSVQWSSPGNVTLIVCSEDWPETRVIRPAYKIEGGDQWGSVSRAAQVKSAPGRINTMTSRNPTVQCDECGDKYTGSYTMSPERLVQWLRDEGWVVEAANRHICPTCSVRGSTA